MTFPSSSGSKPFSLDRGLALAQGVAGNIKSRSSSLSNMLAGTINANVILDFATFLADARAQLMTVSSIPGMAEYAQAQLGDSNLNISTEFTNMIAKIDTCISWIIGNFPASTGFLLVMSFSGDSSGRQTYRQFTSVQTAQLKTNVDALIAAID